MRAIIFLAPSIADHKELTIKGEGLTVARLPKSVEPVNPTVPYNDRLMKEKGYQPFEVVCVSSQTGGPFTASAIEFVSKGPTEQSTIERVPVYIYKKALSTLRVQPDYILLPPDESADGWVRSFVVWWPEEPHTFAGFLKDQKDVFSIESQEVTHAGKSTTFTVHIAPSASLMKSMGLRFTSANGGEDIVLLQMECVK